MAQSTVTVSIKMDEQLKRDFSTVCRNLGLNVSTVVNILARKMTQENRLPFDISIDPFYSRTNIEALQESIKQMQQGKTITKTIEELEELEELTHE